MHGRNEAINGQTRNDILLISKEQKQRIITSDERESVSRNGDDVQLTLNVFDACQYL